MDRQCVIRFQKRGRRQYPVYTIVVIHADRRNRGKSLDVLGHFTPHFTERALEMDYIRLAQWLNKGAILHKSVAKYLYWLVDCKVG